VELIEMHPEANRFRLAIAPAAPVTSRASDGSRSERGLFCNSSSNQKLKKDGLIPITAPITNQAFESHLRARSKAYCDGTNWHAMGLSPGTGASDVLVTSLISGWTLNQTFGTTAAAMTKGKIKYV
jgi:hypothetical protein